MGDANVCSSKWDESNFKLKNIAEEIKSTLAQCGIKLWKDDAKTMAGKLSFSRDSARLWNIVPDSIKQASSLYIAKKEIKKYCNMLVL